MASADFDAQVSSRMLLLLSLGVRGCAKLLVSIAREIQARPEWQRHAQVCYSLNMLCTMLGSSDSLFIYAGGGAKVL